MERDTDRFSTEIEEKHALNSKWIVWYHNPSDKNWSISSAQAVIS